LPRPGRSARRPARRHPFPFGPAARVATPGGTKPPQSSVTRAGGGRRDGPEVPSANNPGPVRKTGRCVQQSSAFVRRDWGPVAAPSPAWRRRHQHLRARMGWRGRVPGCNLAQQCFRCTTFSPSGRKGRPSEQHDPKLVAAPARRTTVPGISTAGGPSAVMRCDGCWPGIRARSGSRPLAAMFEDVSGRRAHPWVRRLSHVVPHSAMAAAHPPMPRRPERTGRPVAPCRGRHETPGSQGSPGATALRPARVRRNNRALSRISMPYLRNLPFPAGRSPAPGSPRPRLSGEDGADFPFRSEPRSHHKREGQPPAAPRSESEMCSPPG